MENSSQQLVDTSDQIINNEEQSVEPIEDFNKQLEDIINTYGSASNLMEEQISNLETGEDISDKETVSNNEANNVESSSNSEKETTAEMLLKGLGNDASLLLQVLNELSSPEEKLQMVLKKYAELLEGQMSEHKLVMSLQKRQNMLIEQRDKLQFEHSRGILARSKLESLCHELHTLNKTLKEDMLQKCHEDERKRSEITAHFQNKLVDIQTQIEHHSNRNDKLCRENNDLAIKLKSIIEKYEKREGSLEKLLTQSNLQQQLSEAKLEEANLRLKETEEKHKREKEYLLKEAIEKTRKCFTMREQELQMKKQLLTHAAEWKLQSKELKEQNTVMQAQLVLYSQKFEEFQSTLAKSNEVYAVFKQEMNKMSDKMKNLEKESNLWKIRFESCNKALTDMIEERSEKGKELEMFTLKITKLETLCRALQDERKVLYDKIKDVRMQTTTTLESAKDAHKQEIIEITEKETESVNNPAITADMENLWKEQVRLQEFAASLLASIADDVEDCKIEKESSEPTLPIKSTADNSDTATEDQCVEKHTREVVNEEASKLVATIPESFNESNSQTETTKEEPTQEDYVLKPVMQHKPKKEVKFNVEVGTETVEPEVPKVEYIQKSIVIEQDPKSESTNENSTSSKPTATAEPAKVESSTMEPEKAEGASATIPKPKGAKPQSSNAQEAKSKSNKPQPKIQSSTKKKGVSKNAKKS